MVFRKDSADDTELAYTAEIEQQLGAEFKTEAIVTGSQLKEYSKTQLLTPAIRKIITVAVVVIAAMVIVAGVITLFNIAVSGESRDSRPTQQETADAAPAEVKITPEKTPPKTDLDPFKAHEVDDEWLRSTAAAVDIPEVALRAYAGAALTLAQEKPACGLGWNTLAAIGEVETQHGSIGEASLDSAGRAHPRIIGVPLDGSEFLATRDSDAGKYDGDTVWDRAVGPMQFVPDTWEKYRRDATGDGAADIDNIFDQSLAAATLLCDVGGDLRNGDNWIRAIAAYNPSVAYNNKVADTADRYARISG